MSRTTFDLPEELHNKLSAAVRIQGITMGIAVTQAIRLWLDASDRDRTRLAGPMVGLNSRDRKKAERYIELLRAANEDIKTLASRRINQFLAIARDERSPGRR